MSLEQMLPTAPALPTQPRASEVANGLVDGNSPLDFIRRNLRVNPESTPEVPRPAEAPQQSSVPAQPAQAAPATPEPAPAPAPGEVTYDIDPKQPAKEKADESKSAQSESSEIGESSEAPEGQEGDDKEVNFQNLRIAVAETKKTLKAKEQELASLAEKLKEYETGAVVPDVIQAKENEISRLSFFEKLHSFKTSREYQEHFATPLSEKQQKLLALGADYAVPPEVMSQALNITNRRDLNRFLASHFDEVGALEAKQIVQEIQDLHGRAKEAEAEPLRSLQELQEQSKAAREMERAQKLTKVAAVSKDAWVESLLKIREEGKAQEIIMQDANPDHNDRIVKPLLTAASTEYGRLVRELSAAGLEELPKPLAYALARMCQLAHASAVSIETRAHAVAHANELEESMKRTSSMIRPPIGSSGISTGSGPAPKSPTNAADAGQMLIDSVLSKRR